MNTKRSKYWVSWVYRNIDDFELAILMIEKPESAQVDFYSYKEQVRVDAQFDGFRKLGETTLTNCVHCWTWWKRRPVWFRFRWRERSTIN
jgi:hypothetical protein